MTQSDAFSDQDLSAYLDGEAPEATVRSLDAALGRDAGLRERLEELRAGQGAFVAAMETALISAPPMPDLPPAVDHARPALWPVALAGAVAGAVLMFGVTWTNSTPSDPGWRAVVANYQSLYVTETLSKVAADPAAQQADLVRISAALGFDLTELPEVAGLSYKRVQQLGFNGKPLAQLTFLAADGGPIALCIIETGGGTSTEIRSEVLSGLDTYSWTDSGFGILLVGPRGQDGLENAAEAFRAALKNRPV